MKPVVNIFKHFFSYVYCFTCERTESKISQDLEICYMNGKYVLNTKNANYSFGSLHRVFQKVFKKIQLQNLELENVLILGFGAGSVTSILKNEYKKECKIIGVEKDNKVVELAAKYFNINGYNGLELHTIDAYDFMMSNNKQFDLVVVDVYIDFDVPSIFEKEEFIKSLKKALNTGGTIIFNKLVKDKDSEDSAQRLYGKFKKIIGKTDVIKIIDTWTNWMLVYKCD